MTQQPKSSYSDRHAQRLAQVLRENLLKRRQQKEQKKEKTNSQQED